MKMLVYLIKIEGLFMLIAAILITSCTTDYSKSQGPIVQGHIDAWNSGDVDALDGIVSENFTRTSPGEGDNIDLDSLKATITQFRSDFPDAKFTVTDQVHSSNKIAISWTFTGTNEALDKPVSVSGLSLIHLDGGKMTREIVYLDNADFTIQLGGMLLQPAPPLVDDAVDIDPDHYSVVMENDRVRVIRITYGAGESSVMHSHRSGVVIFPPSGEENEWNVSWSPAQSHQPGGGDEGTVDGIFVELNN